MATEARESGAIRDVMSCLLFSGDSHACSHPKVYLAARYGETDTSSQENETVRCLQAKGFAKLTEMGYLFHCGQLKLYTVVNIC